MVVTARNILGALIAVTSLLACRGGTPPTVATEPSASATPVPPAPPSAAPSAAAPEAKSCLMVNVCTCNLGCASIRGARSSLREGTRTTALTGVLQGKEVKVVRVVDAAGTSVLALTDLDHDFGCSLTTADKSLMGYACASNKSGPVPANACAGATACD